MTEPDDVRILSDGVTLELAGINLVVSHAPGHTEGSVVFTRPGEASDDPIMFSGDVLFAGSIGRTDLAGGDFEAMRGSLERVIITADDATIVMPGHGPQTTIGAERMTNPFLQFGGGIVSAPSRGM